MAHQYDRWIQKFILKDQEGHIIADSDSGTDWRRAESVGIMINDKEYRFDRDAEGNPLDDTNTLFFDDGKWKIYIDEEQTDLERILTFQCEVSFNDILTDDRTVQLTFHSDKQNQRLSPSLDWSDDV